MMQPVEMIKQARKRELWRAARDDVATHVDDAAEHDRQPRRLCMYVSTVVFSTRNV
jgi:hypothetical protein